MLENFKSDSKFSQVYLLDKKTILTFQLPDFMKIKLK